MRWHSARGVSSSCKSTRSCWPMAHSRYRTHRASFRTVFCSIFRIRTQRVASVEHTPAGTLQLNPRFVPPLLGFTASDYLVSIARRLVEILSSRSSMLSGTRRQKNQTLADFTTADIANFWLLYTINNYFPVLRHLFEV